MSNEISYNIVENDGEQQSVTVFLPGMRPLVATKDHPNFKQIIEGLLTGRKAKPISGNIETWADYADRVRGLFDVGHAIITGFKPLSERVSVAHGKLFFDNDEMPGALADAIIRFHAEGNSDFEPLVNFLEKLQQNPQEHSRQNLYRWMTGRKFGICPDGDFIAYKGLDTDERSIHAGEAIVNGVVVRGKVPNKPGTVIEMPRSKVAFDPRVACSTGLHAGNWRYAREYGQRVVTVKINPRDVVSVPTDSNDEKLRTCRYKVLAAAQVEDLSALFVPGESDKTRRVVVKDTQDTKVVKQEKPKPAKKAAKKVRKAQVKKAAAPKHDRESTPDYYEDWRKRDFETESVENMRWLCKEWEISPIPKTKAALVDALTRKAVWRTRKGLNKKP